MPARARLLLLTALVSAWLCLNVVPAGAVAHPDDPFEPNDTTATATAIAPDGSTYTQYVDGASADRGADCFSFPVQAGKMYAVDVWGAYSGMTGTIELITAAGEQLTNPEGLSQYGPQSATLYYVPSNDQVVYLLYSGMIGYVGPGAPLVAYHVKVAPHEMPALSGKVRNPKSGAPISGARVRAWLDPVFTEQGAEPFEWSSYVATTTAADGSYRAEFDRPGLALIRFEDPGGSLIGEWYESSPMVFTRDDRYNDMWAAKRVQVRADEVVEGVDGSLMEPGRMSVRAVRKDTGEPMPGIGIALLNMGTTTHWVRERIDLPLTEENGESAYHRLDPRCSYVVAPILWRLGLVADAVPPFTTEPGGLVSLETPIEPVWFESTSDARPVYIEAAVVNLLPRTNAPDPEMLWSTDGVGWSPGLVVSTNELGPHTVRFFAYDGWYNEERTRTISFAVVQKSLWTDTSPASVVVPYRNPAVLRARLRAARDGQIASQTVDVQKLVSGQWKDVARATSDANGKVAWTTSPASKSSYRFRYAGKKDWILGSASRTITVLPKARVGAVSARRYGTRRYVLFGSLRPRHAEGTHPVRLYRWRRVSGAWRPYGYVKTTASDYSDFSRYKVRTRFPASGRWRLRAYHPEANHAATWSSYSYVTVR